MNVNIERETCVSCGSCWETCPGLFEQDLDDSFSRSKNTGLMATLQRGHL